MALPKRLLEEERTRQARIEEKARALHESRIEKESPPGYECGNCPLVTELLALLSTYRAKARLGRAAMTLDQSLTLGALYSLIAKRVPKREIAEKLGVSPSALSQWQRRKAVPLAYREALQKMDAEA